MSTKRYEATFQSSDGQWLVDVPAIPGCHTYGRSLAEARRNLRDALGLWVESADTAEIDETFMMPDEGWDVIGLASVARASAETAERLKQEATAQAARTLTRHIGLSVRDAAVLLGISHQRVHQLIGPRPIGPQGIVVDGGGETENVSEADHDRRRPALRAQ